MSEQTGHNHFSNLTANEVSNLWSSYLKNSMEQRLFEYFYESCEDEQIKAMAKKILDHAKLSLEELTVIFNKDNLTTPHAFTEQDVTPDAHKVFSDTFILYFCHDITMLSLSTYPSALSDCSRPDVRDFFQKRIEMFMSMQNDVINLMLEKGIYLKPAQLEMENEVDFVQSKKYLSGVFTGSRPVNALEIANLTRILHRAQFSKMVFVTLHKLANKVELKEHFSQGRNGIESVLESLSEVLEKENIPLSASSDFQISPVEMSPFSDKLMLFFVNTCLGMFCFQMVSQALNSTLRTDINMKLTKISTKMRKYYSEGILIAIKEGWFEQPPNPVDHKV